MGFELGRRWRNLFGESRNRYFGDDFNWDTYTRDKYGPQQARMEKDLDLRLPKGARFDREAGVLDAAGARIHPNSRAIYEVVGLLAPQSVLEIGCGGGDHLANLRHLYPEIALRGVDRSQNQLDFLRERNPAIASHTSVCDITMPHSRAWQPADLVYTQAVVMHINTAVSHLVALANIFRLANRHVVLMENYGCHPFHEDVRRLHEGGHIDWPELHAHVHHVDGRPYCLVFSQEATGLPPLGDYFELPNARKMKYARATA